MREYKIALQNGRLVFGDGHVSQLAKTSIDAINRSAAGSCLSNKRRRRLDWGPGIGMQGNIIIATPDLFKLDKRNLTWNQSDHVICPP
jgi:hypothetical protein